MTELLQISSQFPTLIYSVFLGIIVVYWLIGLLGILDLDLAGDVDVDADVSIGGMTGFFLTFGLTGVPFTLVISIISLLCWLISFYLQVYLLTWLPEGWLYYLFGLVSIVIVFFISLPITAVIIRPLKGMFNSVETASSEHFVGKEAIIATSTVSETFGQARLFHDGAEILIDVRCYEDQSLTSGSKVLLVEYVHDKHAYIVSPYF